MARMGRSVGAMSFTASRFGFVLLVVLDLLRQLPDALVLPVFSLFSGTVGHSMLSFTLGWGVIGVVLYKSTLLFLPKLISIRGFRATFTLLALAQAIVVSNLLNSNTNAFQTVVVFGLLAVFSASVLVAYLRFVAGWSLFDPDGHAASLLDAFVPSEDMRGELQKDRSYEGRLRSFALGIWVAGLGVVLEVPCAIAGFAAALLATAFPLPDVLLLGLVLAESERTPLSGETFDVLDLENRAYATLKNATRNMKGAVLIVLATVGGVSAALVFSSSLSIFGNYSSLAYRTYLDLPLAAWNFIGVMLLVSSAAIYSLWYWIRQLERVTGFVDVWVGNVTVFAGPTRPRGLTLPPMMAFVTVAVFTQMGLDPFSFAYAVTWPGLLVFLLWCVHWTRQTPPQRPLDEDRTIAVALCVQYVGIWIAGSAGQLTDNHLLAVALDPGLLAGLVSVVAGTYLPDVIRYEREQDDVRRYAGAAYLLGLGILIGGLASLSLGLSKPILALLAGVCAVGGLALAAGKYVEHSVDA